jgi:hypothetical protein
MAATCDLVQFLLVVEACSCTCDELGRSDAQFPGCLGYEGDLFLGGLYPNPNHEPPPELQPPLSPGFKVQKSMGWRRRLARYLED